MTDRSWKEEDDAAVIDVGRVMMNSELRVGFGTLSGGGRVAGPSAVGIWKSCDWILKIGRGRI
eukprot:scaffold29664_cov51-Attheya_sp.AAC.2